MPRTTDGDQPTLSAADLAALVSTLQVELLGLKSHVTARDVQIDSLRETILNLTHENELLRRRIYGNKTERTGTSELQLALGGLLDDEKRLQKQFDEAVSAARGAGKEGESETPGDDQGDTKSKPKGRRDLSASKLPWVTMEILDEELEETAKRIGFDDTYQLMLRRGGWMVLVKRIAKYEVAGKDALRCSVCPCPGRSSRAGYFTVQPWRTFLCRSSR